jgi:hypothetical protein
MSEMWPLRSLARIAIMSNFFPNVSTISLRDAQPGSIVKIARSDGPKLALVADHFTNGIRSFVWINPGFKDRPPVIFVENWRNDPCVLLFGPSARFELGTEDRALDPGDRKSWETAGAMVLVGNELFIRAAPGDDSYGRYALVSVRNGSVSFDRSPDISWTFLSWQLWVRDPLRQCDLMLTEFHAAR